ncbi:MAG: hypothetical protein RIR18_2296 [Pseudomonadota bacterium]
MKFSQSWLRSFVDTGLPTEELSHLLTMAGLEVEELDPVAPVFDGVIVARVLSVTKHPDADRLNVCQVDIGTGSPQQIVCGAPNVAEGLNVPCALPGAKLPGDFNIKIAKVRGIESSGMLCSSKELGITEESSGLLVLPIDAPVGQSIRQYLDLDDQLFTIKLTPNRADCLSLTGIAREVAALTGKPLSLLDITDTPATHHAQRNIELQAADACPRYCGRIITEVNAAAVTPDWMKQRLERSGIRSISALVDITNYVLLELGQPLHAFDNDLLKGSLQVRLANAEERIKLLNEQTVTLSNDVLVIADDAGAQAIAGIMGGAGTSVTDNTHNVFIESAFFAPKAIAGRARRLGFSSDSSHRFERGVDFANTRHALERATQLIVDICGGQVGPISEALTVLPDRKPVLLRGARVRKVLGIDLTATTIAELFTRLALPFVQDSDNFTVTPPSYRFDIEIEEDLIEEVARLYGYDNIPSLAPKGTLAMLPQTESRRIRKTLRQLLANRGYQETINFAFVEESWEQDFADNATPIRLANPIASQLSVMRSSLIAGLVSNLQTNLKRKQTRIRLFEMGRTFTRDAQANYLQPWKLAFLAAGSAQPEGWNTDGRRADFFDIKADLCALFSPQIMTFSKAKHPSLHPGRTADVSLNGRVIGVIGELHPEWVQKYDLTHPPILVEIELESAEQTTLASFQEVSRFPSVTRDLAVVVDQHLTLGEILSSMQEASPSLVKDIQLFDIYVGKGIPEGKKSLAFRVVMQDTEKTLQDSDVEPVVQQLLTFLSENFAAQQRA